MGAVPFLGPLIVQILKIFSDIVASGSLGVGNGHEINGMEMPCLVIAQDFA